MYLISYTIIKINSWLILVKNMSGNPLQKGRSCHQQISSAIFSFLAVYLSVYSFNEIYTAKYN